ncbi:DUF362 domain-containing protein [Haloferax sp. DFSO52]|uniref:DUF362 domain-containing protein n=1 Tax=Haloferax sp. DFSO52 TaxID=3388505 RepID=UPI003A8C3457
MDFPTRSAVDGLIEPQQLPTFARVRYEPPSERIEDPPSVAQAELDDLDVLSTLDDGATVAVGVGSRGIHAIDSVAKSVVSRIEERGFEPVVVPAMGSHGGATSEGQREVLSALGITEESVGAPIDARMDTSELDTVTVGETSMPVHFSTAALECDAIIVVNRIKAHTNFTGEIESGLSKMTVVGLGKQHGAKSFHSTAIKEGYVESLTTALETIQSTAPPIAGIALVENFHEEIAHVEAVSGSSFVDREPELLEMAYVEMPTLPFDEIDLLVVDELGKEISGAGMDTNVIGRYRVLNAPDPEHPNIKLIYARGLTERTKGNGTGIGLADITRKAAIDQLDLQKTYANALTSGSLAKIQIPVVCPDDEFSIRTALAAVGGYDPETVRIVWIQNTQLLTEFRVSEPLVDELPESANIRASESLVYDDGTATFTDEDE